VWTIEQIAKLVKDVPDFPKKGILFKDITPVLESHEAFLSLARHFARRIDPSARKILAIESRGFILGAAVAQHLNVGLVLVRKKGKLPRATLSQGYDLEYGTDHLEIHRDALTSGESVAIIDDVLATGGTAQAVAQLASRMDARVTGAHFMMEIAALKGRDKLPGVRVDSLLTI
jgi:adenine phosphoribosyltransferase